MDYLSHIVRDPTICGGEAVIKGTRVTLRTVLASLAEGAGADEILADFPTLTAEDVRAVVAFAAASTEEDLPVPSAPPFMRIKLDENLPVTLAPLLSVLGHDVDTVPEEQLQGRHDPVIWQAAQDAERFLVTQDMDFSDIRQFRPGTHPGILLLRLRTPGRTALTARLVSIFQTEDVESWSSCFVVATERKIRVVRPSHSVSQELLDLPSDNTIAQSFGCEKGLAHETNHRHHSAPSPGGRQAGPGRCRGLPADRHGRAGLRPAAGQAEVYRGHEFSVNLLRKVQLMIGVNDAFVEPTIEAIIKGGRSGPAGEIGDGKIFVLPLEDCVRIRTGERGGEAI